MKTAAVHRVSTYNSGPVNNIVSKSMNYILQMTPLVKMTSFKKIKMHLVTVKYTLRVLRRKRAVF